MRPSNCTEHRSCSRTSRSMDQLTELMCSWPASSRRCSRSFNATKRTRIKLSELWTKSLLFQLMRTIQPTLWTNLLSLPNQRVPQKHRKCRSTCRSARKSAGLDLRRFFTTTSQDISTASIGWWWARSHSWTRSSLIGCIREVQLKVCVGKWLSGIHTLRSLYA